MKVKKVHYAVNGAGNIYFVAFLWAKHGGPSNMQEQAMWKKKKRVVKML